jgi:hypothetical protein
MTSEPVFSALSQLFTVERHRPRAGEVGFSVPAITEIDVADGDIEPLLATNMRGGFLRTRVSRAGTARYGYSECALDQEPALFRVFYQTLVREAEREGWGTVRTVSEACELMTLRGVRPAVVVAPEALETGLRCLVSELPPGAALVSAGPVASGVYTRIGNYVGILAYRVDKVFVVVVP